MKEIKQEIFRLVKEAPDLDYIHWLIAVDNCFENDEFHKEDFGDLQWRLSVLWDFKKLDISHLVKLIEPILTESGIDLKAVK